MQEILSLIDGRELNPVDIAGLSAFGSILLFSIIQFISALKTKSTAPKKTETQVDDIITKPVPAEKVEVKPEAILSFRERMKKGLSKSRTGFWGKVEGLFATEKLTKENIEELEELLYSSDLGAKTVQLIMDELENNLDKGGYSLADLKVFLKEMLGDRIRPIQEKADYDFFTHKESSGETKVVMVVGVNGAGKTTTIGKLATKLKRQGANVVVGACDTFRAAAVDQLQVWCERSGATMIRAKENSDPSGVAYEALKQALEQKADYCILDTAGRLHNNQNLMDELTKNKRVLTKLKKGAPHHTLLVIDSITGQNAMKQAQEFNKALDISGLVFTKCEGSSKAGNAIPIVEELQVPIVYIGVGETVEDIDYFRVDDYLDALLN